MGEVPDNFFASLDASLSIPNTPTTLHCWEAWEDVEGGSASFNPFNTTLKLDYSTDYNDAGVQNYPSEAMGLHATVLTLQESHYAGVLLALREQDAIRFGEAVDASPWGTKGLAEYLREHPAPSPTPLHPPVTPPPGTVLPVLREGAGMPPAQPSGPVFTLQHLLRGHGFTVVADGRFGPATEADVRVFQSDHGLAVDGVVGRITWAALLRVEY